MKACRLLLAVATAISWTGVANAQFAPQYGPPPRGSHAGFVMFDGSPGAGVATVESPGGPGIVSLDGAGPRSQDSVSYVDHGDGGHYVDQWGGGQQWADGTYVDGAVFDQCCDCGPRWAVNAGFIAMKRVANEGQLVQFNANPATTAFVDTLDARDFDYAYGQGVDAGIVFGIDTCNAVEFRYFFFDDSSGDVRRTVTAGNANGPGFGMFQPGVPSVAVVTAPLSTFVRPSGSIVTAESRSGVDSAELNVRSQVCCGRVTLLGGFRYLNLNEKLTINGAGALGQQFIWKTDNDLFGFQAGTEIALAPVNEHFRFDGVLKGGVYYNDATSDVFDSGVPGVGPRQLLSGDDEVSFVGEAGIYATWKFAPRWSLRGGYQALWLHSVAAAQDQVFKTGQLNAGLLPLTHDADTNANVIYHGANISLIAEF